MKPATVIHAAALIACFAVHMVLSHELDGVRRAMETMKPVPVPVTATSSVVEAA